MRRNDREIREIEKIVEIMDRCDVCRLAFNDENYPYIIPLNYGLEVKDGAVVLYFHSATEGYKLQLIEKDNRAAFEMDCKHKLQYFSEKGYCTYAYESVAGCGEITILDGEEKVHGLKKIMEHYHQGEEVYFNPAAIPRTTVYKLTAETITGKVKKPKTI